MLVASFIGFGTVALAASEFLDVSTTTTELLEGATVEFAATITAGDTDLEGYKITCNGSVCYNSGGAKLLANETKNVSFSMEVTTAMLGNPIEFVLSDDISASLATDS